MRPVLITSSPTEKEKERAMGPCPILRVHFRCPHRGFTIESVCVPSPSFPVCSVSEPLAISETPYTDSINGVLVPCSHGSRRLPPRCRARTPRLKALSLIADDTTTEPDSRRYSRSMVRRRRTFAEMERDIKRDRTKKPRKLNGRILWLEQRTDARTPARTRGRYLRRHHHQWVCCTHCVLLFGRLAI